ELLDRALQAHSRNLDDSSGAAHASRGVHDRLELAEHEVNPVAEAAERAPELDALARARARDAPAEFDAREEQRDHALLVLAQDDAALAEAFAREERLEAAPQETLAAGPGAAERERPVAPDEERGARQRSVTAMD